MPHFQKKNLNLILFWLISTMVACANVPTNTNRLTLTPTRIRNTELATVILTSTPEPSISPTPQPVFTPVSILVQPPLPQLLLSLSSDASPLSTCHQELATPGQVWITSDPYSESSALLSNAETAFYYPAWSPDHQWISYIVVHPENGKETLSRDIRILDYSNSDSVWIMRPDGTHQRQVSKGFMRSEAFSPHTSGETCDVISGIVSFVGWSDDSQWLAFTQRSAESEKGSELYVINMMTGEQISLAKGILPSTPIWQPDRNQLALIRAQPDEIEVLNAADPEVPPQIFSLPSSLPMGYRLSRIQWGPGGHQLLVMGTESFSSSDAHITLWRVDLVTQRWEKIADLGAERDVRLNSDKNSSLLCYSSKFELRSNSDWTLITSVDIRNGINCATMNIWHDGVGQEAVGFINGVNHRQIWAIRLAGEPYSLQKIIEANDFGLPEGLEIIDLAWQR